MVNPPSRLMGLDAERGVVIEGWLKKKRSLIQRNKKNYYKVIGTNMYLAPNHKKRPNELEFRYDLTLYTVGVSKKEKKEFFLEPIDKSLKLDHLRFIAETAELRLHWYKALSAVMKEDDGTGLNRSFLSANSF